MAHAGDSRFYQLQPGQEVIQLSTDHSFKAVVAASPQNSERFRGMENVIYRAVGLHRNFELELKLLPVVSGARYFICTDGMYRSLSAERIKASLSEAVSPRSALDVFMRVALLSGGKDNITGITVFVDGDSNG